MALAQTAFQERKPSAFPLSSTNPFRNRRPSPAGPAPNSPAFPSPTVIHPLQTPALDIGNAPKLQTVSRNPFLAVFDDDNDFATQKTPPKSTAKAISFSVDKSSPKRAGAAGNATELFNNLTLSEKPPVNGNVPKESTTQRTGMRHPPTHRPTRSQEEAEQRALNGIRGSSKTRGALIEVDLFDRVVRGENRRPRRNSESSVLDKGDERKRRERRQKEKDGRDKDSKPRDGRPSKGKRGNVGLDLIDKLDVTGIYGTGLFHHDGPFDACNPHRNRKRDARAPMQAFPEGSANNVMGGSGPVNKTLNFDQIHGRGVEGFHDYNPATNGTHNGVQFDQYGLPIRSQQLGQQFAYNPKETYTINPTDRVEQVHGQVSAGLGSSTFLEGAPAPRSAMQRRESENQDTGYGPPGGGLQRKKSIVQKIRGISRSRTGLGDPLRSPEARYTQPYGSSQGTPPRPWMNGIQSAGGRGRMMVETNPFFEEYEAKGGVSATAAPVAGLAGRKSADSNPSRFGTALSRRMTEGSQGDGEPKSGGGGFLSRVKSLRGGRRTRPERAGS